MNKQIELKRDTGSLSFVIRRMNEDDVNKIAHTFSCWGKNLELCQRYEKENQSEKRVTLVAVSAGQVIGYTNVVWQSDYEPFLEAGIPEINDMSVITRFQKQGIGTALIEKAEKIAIAKDKKEIGIGFGLTPDYGSAQRLYVKLGYIPDGRGAKATSYGDVLYLTKRLKQ